MANDAYSVASGGTVRAAWPVPAPPAWLEGAALWEWIDVPNTALSGTPPTRGGAAYSPTGGSGPASKISAWCGATLRRTGSVYMIGAAGGHLDYAGNEINALALNTDAPQWVQLTDPSLNGDVYGHSITTGADAFFHADLRPSPTHTYNATHFIEALDTFIVMPSPGSWLGTEVPANSIYSTPGKVFAYEYGAANWRLPTEPTYFDSFTGSGDFTACMCVSDPLTGDVYYNRGSGFQVWRFRPTAAQGSQWTLLSTQGLNGGYVCNAFDPVRKRWLVVGSFETTRPAQVYRASDGANITGTITFGGLGETVLPRTRYQGMCFDEANDQYLVFNNDGATITVQSVNANTWAVANVATTGTPPAQRPNGIHNAVQYVPELKGIVLANSYTGNVKFMRVAA